MCSMSSGLTHHYNLPSKVHDQSRVLCILTLTSIPESLSATPPYRPSQLAASYLRTAHTHLEYIVHTAATLHRQHQAARIASSSLELNVLAISDVFDGIAVTARKDLERQTTLLAGLDADLEIISRVKIHIEFMSPAVRNAIENGERPRTLGDYVSNVKMKQVAEACARTHGTCLYGRMLGVLSYVAFPAQRISEPNFKTQRNQRLG
jgi:hypothetical protein